MRSPMPSPGDQMNALAQRVLPLFAEYGITAMVIIGYQEDGEGNVKRVCIAQTGNNPAYQDALRPAIHFAHMWGSEPHTFVPRSTPDSPPTESSGLAPG